ncbi:DNA glycosylase AlkZ-like family protein [Microbacterium lacticum]
MDPEGLRAARMRAHRPTDPASGVVAARHMTATQSQEFTSGRWALAVRSTGSPALADVDAAFERGERIRSWTQRGTVHILDPRDLGWMLGITAGRQLRQAAGVHRRLGIDDDVLARAESAVRPVLRGDNRLIRRELGTVLTDAGIDASGMRANLILVALCLRRLVVLGPVVPREGAPSREQYVVAADEWVEDATAPAGPLAEILVRYLRGHGPAGLADFRWWAGLPLGLARSALEGAGTRVTEVEEGLFAEAAGTSATAGDSGAAAPEDAAAPDVVALPAFDEYYLSYADRTVAASPRLVAAIGPGPNGAVAPVLVTGGRVVGTLKQALAVDRHHLAPVVGTVEVQLDEASVAAALARSVEFLAGGRPPQASARSPGPGRPGLSCAQFSLPARWQAGRDGHPTGPD